MFKLLVILFIVKLYARNNIFKIFQKNQKLHYQIFSVKTRSNPTRQSLKVANSSLIDETLCLKFMTSQTALMNFLFSKVTFK